MKTSYKIAIAFIGFLAIGLVSFGLLGGNEKEIEFFTTDVIRGTIQNTVTATGTVESVVTVQVGSQVSGQIQTLYADFNSVVNAGQVLAKLDPRTFESALENAEANLASARARVKTSEADLANTQASLESSYASLRALQVDAEKAQIMFRRSEELKAAELISQTDYDNSKATADAAVARVEQAEASIKQVKAQIVSREAGLDQSLAQVTQAKADVNRAEINLEYTNIYSPVDGVVISREVDVGQTVAASMSAPTLFMIANDLSLMRVNASIDEADIGKLSQSNRISFTVDAYPAERFRGFIEEIRLNPQTVQNVVTYSVIIGVNNQDLKLKPGMTANITVTVDRQDDVLSIPNSALRYTPPNVDVQALTTERTNRGRGAEGQAVSSKTDSTGRGNRRNEVFQRGRGQARQGGGPRQGADFGAGTPRRREFSAQRGELAMAAPGQMWDAGEKLQFRDAPPALPRPGLVWVLDDSGIPEARDVTLGITDGARSAVIVSDLQDGDQLIIGDSSQADASGSRQGFNPLAFGGRAFGGRGRR